MSNIQRLKYSININPSKSEVMLSADADVSFLPMEAVSEDGHIEPVVRKLEDVSQGYTYFRNGDVVMAKITPCFENGKGAVVYGLVNNVGFGTTEFIVMRPNSKDIDPHYLHYLVSSDRFRKTGETDMRGSAGQKRVPESFVANYHFAKPSIELQQERVKYLDSKLSILDEAIQKKRKLIEIMKEKRISTIHLATTRGLKNVNSVDSGVSWIGNIAAQWKLVKISRSFKLIGSGSTPKSGNEEYYVDGDTAWVNTGDLNDGLILDTKKNINAKGLDYSSALKIYPVGTLLIAMYGATIGKIGLLGIDACTNQACCALADSNDFEIKFVYYWFLANRKNIVEMYSYGSGQPNISQNTIRSLQIPCPPKNEQKIIVRWLDERIAIIERLISSTQNSIHLLNEYRASLIESQIVT